MKNSPETLKRRAEKRKLLRNSIDPSSFPHQIKKVCKDCKEMKLCNWLSSFTQKGIPEYRARCRDCQNAYFRKRNKLDYVKKAKNKNRKKLLIKRKQKAIDVLGGECKRCGYKKSIRALTFHHRNPKEKKFDIGAIKDYAWSKVLKELKKCDLLCFNCHMELHEKLNDLL